MTAIDLASILFFGGGSVALIIGEWMIWRRERARERPREDGAS